MNRSHQENFMLPSPPLVESKDGVINLVQDGRLVQHIQPGTTTQTLYSSPSVPGVPYRQIFVKFEGPPTNSANNPSNQRLILPNTLAPSTSHSATQSTSNVQTTGNTQYVIQPVTSQGVASASPATYISVESLRQTQHQREQSSLSGVKTAYIIHPESSSESSTLLRVGESLPIGHGNITLGGLPLTLSNADTRDDLTIATSSASILNEGDSTHVTSGLGLGQDALLSSSQGGLADVHVPTDISHAADTEEEGCVVDPKSFLNTEPTENITDHNAFINTSDKITYSSKISCEFTGGAKEVDVKTHGNISDLRDEAAHADPTEPQVFSLVEATLSDALLKAIPGCKDVFLKQVANEHHVSMRHEITTDSFIVSGEIVKILDMETSLNELVGNEAPLPPKPYRGILNEKNGNIEHVKVTEPNFVDKGVVCHLLKPQYSRSGRELKWKTIEEIKSDEEENQIMDGGEVSTSKKSAKMIRTTSGKPNKRKRGRPRKVAYPEIQDMAKKVNKEVASVGDAVKTRKDINSKEGISTPEEGESNEDQICQGKEDETLTENEKENRYRLGVMTDLEEKKRKQQKPKKDYEALAPFKYFCNLCSFKTKRESHMKKHKEIHKKGLPLLKCNKCDYTTLRTTHLRRHEMEHSTEFYYCPICKYKSDSKKLLARHYRVKHTGSQSGPPLSGHAVYACEICDYKTTRIAQFQRHAKCHADVASDGSSDKLIKSYICPLCPYKTTRKEHFLRHNNNVHSERRPYLCDLCGKAFKRRDALKTHWLIHKDKSSRTYPFRCNTCQKGFRCQAHLTEHQTIHSNVRAYLCEICGASFKTRTVQRKHVQSIHKNPRAFACKDCNKRFNTRYGLRRHVKTHESVMKQEESAMSDSVLVHPALSTAEEELNAANQQQHIQIQIGDSNIIAELQSVEQVQMAGEVDDHDADGHLKEEHIVHTALIEESMEQGREIHIPITTLVQQAGSNETTTALLYLPNFATIGN